MDFLERAKELKEETVANRRYFHENAEVGLNLPKTKKYVCEKLNEYGITPKECGNGITATIGSGGKVILLRADMDALPMAEESGLDFACKTGTEAHTCGHDLHAAMLLTSAKILKENESSLKGTVKLMFQPAEETFEGGKDMVEAGILENPHVDAALAVHVSPSGVPGGFFYNDDSTMMNSCDGFRINIKGKGSHGAFPNFSIDPINIGTHIYSGLQELIARENNPAESSVLTVGHFQAGTAFNIIPETAVMEGSIRTASEEARKLLVTRMKEVASLTAKTFRGEAEVEMLSEVPPLICNSEFTKKIIGYTDELNMPGKFSYPGIRANGSDDFAEITSRVPGTYLFLSAGFKGEEGYGSHNPKVRFNEEVLPFGAAILASCAVKWMEE